MPRLADLLVGRRLLFYALLLLYIGGLLLGGRACRLASVLIPLVPFALAAALTIDYAREGDLVTALSGVVLMIFILGWGLLR